MPLNQPNHCKNLTKRGYCVIALPLLLALTGCNLDRGPLLSQEASANSQLTIKADPTSVSLQPGQTGEISVSVNGGGRQEQGILVHATSASPDVIVSPVTGKGARGQEQTFTITAGPGSEPKSVSVRVAAVSSESVAETWVNVVLTMARPNRPPRPDGATPLPSRNRFVRTDATTFFSHYDNKYWTAYSALTRRFYTADPWTNRVFVVDAASQRLVGTIDVPGAYGIDIDLDGRTLYVGTQIGDLYFLDAVNMIVTRRYRAAEIGPYGFATFVALALQDGRFALLGGQGGIPGVGGYATFAIWNPADNSMEYYTSLYGNVALGFSGIPYKPICGAFMGNFVGFERAPDRRTIVVGSHVSDNTVCKLDTQTGVDTYWIPEGHSRRFSLSPDGKKILFLDHFNTSFAVLYDFETLTKEGRWDFSPPADAGTTGLFSPDSRTIYIPTPQVVLAFDAATRMPTGWLSNIYIPALSRSMFGASSHPPLRATDGGSLVGGPVQEGFAFVDLSDTKTGSPSSTFFNGRPLPLSGPVSGGTQVRYSVAMPTPAAVYLDNEKAGSPAFAEALTFSTPAGNPGPADLYIFLPNGMVGLVPESFSYGPSIMRVPTDLVSSEGGIGWLYGYGLGPEYVSSPTIIPADLRVLVDGIETEVKAFRHNTYDYNDPAFPLQAIQFVIPPGTGIADISVTTANGAAILPNGIQYVAAPERFPLQDSELTQGIYDRCRDRYYFADRDSIQVFSLSQRQWLSPIQIPAPPASTQRLWSLAISPDCSKIAVSDRGAKAVYVFEIESPGQISTRVLMHIPAGVAISDQGMVYYAVATPFLGSGYALHRFHWKTGESYSYPISAPASGNDDFLRVALSADNQRIYFNQEGRLWSIDAQSDRVTFSEQSPGCCYGDNDLHLAANNTRVAGTGYFWDADMNAETWLGLTIPESRNMGYYYGGKLSADGSVYFQPSTTGLDVLDARNGGLLHRVAAPLAYAGAFDSLVSNGKDNVLLAITEDGIAVLDLTWMPVPTPVTYSSEAALGDFSAGGVDRPQRVTAAPMKQPSPLRPNQVPHLTKLD